MQATNGDCRWQSQLIYIYRIASKSEWIWTIYTRWIRLKSVSHTHISPAQHSPAHVQSKLIESQIEFVLSLTPRLSVMIITSPLNAPDTLLLLDQLTAYNHSKILIIDIIGTIFNKQNDFYKSITRNKDKWLTNNLLVLTTLTDKLKRFLNATFTTEYKNIYGKSETQTTSTTEEATPAASVVDRNAIDANADHHHERNVLQLLMDSVANRKKKIDDDDDDNSNNEDEVDDNDDADGSTGDANFINSFNEIQLHAVLNLFHAKFFNGNCTHKAPSDSPNKLENVSESATTNQTTRFGPCPPNANSLMKCETYLRATLKMAAMPAPGPAANATVLCEQIARHVHRVNGDDRNKRHANWSVGSGGENVTQEFIHLIPHQNDTKFSEYFTFFDFIVAKLAKTNNLSVNYSTAAAPASNVAAAVNGGGGGAGGAGGADIFDFCVLDFHVSRFIVNQTAATTAFVWRPFLILRQSEINQNLYITHPLIVGYHNWFFDGSSRFWTCGLLCWILAGIVLLLLICILVAGVTFGLAIR